MSVIPLSLHDHTALQFVFYLAVVIYTNYIAPSVRTLTTSEPSKFEMVIQTLSRHQYISRTLPWNVSSETNYPCLLSARGEISFCHSSVILKAH